MTISKLKPLPTKYQGVLFRSRLEARWAVFFDYLNLHWSYEAQSFKLDDRKDKHPDSCYCPDFLVRTPQGEDMWIEIKPHNIKQNNKFDKFKKLVDCPRVHLLSGQPEDALKTHLICPRCGDFGAELLTDYEHDREQTVRCYPCDAETPSGGGHPFEYNNVLQIPIRPHKGDLKLLQDYFVAFTMQLMDASDRARTYRFY